jgi:hypothetical protein
MVVVHLLAEFEGMCGFGHRVLFRPAIGRPQITSTRCAGAAYTKGLRGSGRQALIAWTAGSRPVPSLRVPTLSSVEGSGKAGPVAVCSLPDHRNDHRDQDSVPLCRGDVE